MLKQQNKVFFIIPTIVAIISAIAFAVITIMANQTTVDKEILDTLAVGKMKAVSTLQTGEVVVKYVDVSGNEIAESTTITGNVGEEYKAVRKDIATYSAYGSEPKNKAGNITSEIQNITFVYQKEDSSVEVSEENNTVTVKTLHNRNAKEYDVKIITKDENGNLVKGVSYSVTDSANNVFRNGKVEGDSFVVGTLTISEAGEETYSIEEDSAPYYEKLEERAIQFKVSKMWIAEKNEYGITVDYPTDLNGVSFEVTENEIIINITNKEIEVEKVFDFEIEKYIEKVIVKENGKITHEYNNTDKNPNEIIKVDIAKSKINKTKLEITYKFVVENIGNIPGRATEITDYLPNEFKYISGSNWVYDGKNYTTNEIKDMVINNGDKKELEMVVEWDLTENSIGKKENIAEITKYSDEEPKTPEEPSKPVPDKTPDNVDNAEIIAEVKTGNNNFAIGITLLVLNIIIIIVCILKKIGKES